MFRTLHLFVVDGATLERVLAQTICLSTLTAGDGNPDDIRQPQEAETSVVIAALSTAIGRTLRSAHQ